MSLKAKRLLPMTALLIVGLLSACRAEPPTPPVILQPPLPAISPTTIELPAVKSTDAPQATPTVLAAASSPTSLPSEPPVPSATYPATPDPQEILPRILAAFKAQQQLAWRYTSDIRMENGEAHTTVFEFVPPDRYRIVSDSASEVIGAAGKVYLRQGEAWVESPVPASSIVDPGFSGRLEQTIGGLQFTGFETMDGVPMLVFEYTSTYRIGLEDASSQTRLWLGVEDQLIHRIVIDGAIATLDHRTGTTTNTPAVTTIDYEYDPEIMIEVPMIP